MRPRWDLEILTARRANRGPAFLHTGPPATSCPAAVALAMTITCRFFDGPGLHGSGKPKAPASHMHETTLLWRIEPCPQDSQPAHLELLMPVNAVWFNAIVSILLMLLIFGGTAIGAIFSISAIAAATALYDSIFIKTVFIGSNFRRGPWHLGKFSIPLWRSYHAVSSCT